MPVKSAFQPEIVAISITEITPIKAMTVAYRKTDTYRRIAASMAHVGLIEPLIVFPTTKGTYILLDGHTRLDILAAMSVRTVNCLLATDNESYTYNKRVNYIPPIAPTPYDPSRALARQRSTHCRCPQCHRRHYQGAVRAKLGITRGEWSRFGRLANDKPLQQGRHRGANAGNLRDATEGELQEVRGIARKMIEAYLALL